MPAKLDRCVRKVKARGKKSKSAWAICRAKMAKKRKGRRGY